MTMGMRHKPILRGGSWNNNDNNCRVANRNNNNPDNSNNNNGVRVANTINLIKQPELAGGISAGSAILIAQFHVQVLLHRIIFYRLVGLSPRTPYFLYLLNQGGFKCVSML